MQEILFNLIYCVCYALILAAVKAVVTVLIPYIRAKLTKSQYEWAALIIKNAVHAYEQTIEGSGKGEIKYNLVLESVKHALKEKGITISNDQLNLLIESAVNEMNTAGIVFAGTVNLNEDANTLDEEVKYNRDVNALEEDG